RLSAATCRCCGGHPASRSSRSCSASRAASPACGWAFACRTPRSLQRVRVRLGNLAGFPLARSLERLEGTSFVDVDHRVELLGKRCLEVVAQPLTLRQIDHADRAFEQASVEQLRALDDEVASELVESLFPTPGQRGAHALALGLAAPSGCGGDGARIRREADGERLPWMALAGEPAEIDLAALTHLGGTRVADVRVVRPHDDAAPDVFGEPVEGVRHVCISEVPRGRTTAK